VIRVRRVASRFGFIRSYELEFDGRSLRASRSRAVRHLQSLVGIGDAWSFIVAADRTFDEGSSSWAVEYEPKTP
jgi:hypothetical protein